ncbi:MAG: hypothetical protein AAFN48_03765 [Pseudomonadota bacterium]
MIDAQSFTPPTMDATLVVSLTALVGITLVVFALLRAWQDWLALKNRELDNLSGGGQSSGDNPQMSVGAARIELADMKERIKKLEAIASGVEL